METSVKNVLTIDVEDWYHSSLDLFKDSPVQHGAKPDMSVVDNTIQSLNLLSTTGNKATFFVLGTVAEHYPDVVKEILRRGHEVATHGYSHKLVYNVRPEEFEDDLKISVEYLNKAGCEQILGYRAPYWSITRQSLWALEVLQRLGLKYDSSIFPIRRGLYGIPGANPGVHKIAEDFWEFPPATIRMFGINWPIAGGGYLRMVPYRIIASAVRKSSSRQLGVFYFHPFELDPMDVHLKHNVKSASTFAYWLQQKVGRGSNPDKLKRLLSEFKFTSIKEALSNLQTDEWNGSNADTDNNRRR
jgi:polysaccharide deacetylase family protein (PEP-CTERM system associated)